MNSLVKSFQPPDLVKITHALEITAIDPGKDCELLVSWWSNTIGAEARNHLIYHLNRLGLAKAAQAIIKEQYLGVTYTFVTPRLVKHIPTIFVPYPSIH